MGSLVEADEPADLPYWNVDVPPEQRTDECPPHLVGVSPKDRSVLATPDHLFERDSWDVVKQKVAARRLDQFKRTPAELRRYREFTWRLQQQDPDGILHFILAHRLHWPRPIVARGRAPFECDDDVKVLWNDCPYGVDARIVHLVVWVKFELEEDPATGLVTEAMGAAIDGYVRRTFSRVPEDRVIWFKNWGAIKSVQAIEHFHVMLFDPDLDYIQQITKGDVPPYKRKDWSPF
ncbi:hypothetical protein QBC39DRAFT_342571 [Podospora conica]|nr:hypothetical protein QBC39DRAFT_342571 [Schizothecium conicum]